MTDSSPENLLNPSAQDSLLGIVVSGASSSELLGALKSELNLPVLDQTPEALPEGGFVVAVDESGVSLCYTGRKVPGPIQVDFVQGASAHRRQFGGGKNQLIAKAVGIKSSFRPQVLDLTAGLGQDAFVLATLGCDMTLVERVPVVYQLLKDGINRAKQSADLTVIEIASRMTLHNKNSHDFLTALPEPADVIYLDPMFPEREKSAQVNKSMRAFHSLVGGDLDAGELLKLALEKARYRVVIKRPRKAQAIHEQFPDSTLPAPGLVISGKSSRYDIYPIQKMPN